MVTMVRMRWKMVWLSPLLDYSNNTTKPED